MSDLKGAMAISAAGMRAQGLRMRIIAENMANADSVATGPNDTPYQRKILTFKNTLDRTMGVNKVKPDRIVTDSSDFGQKYDPGHPAADANGYIQTPNVNGLVESMDMMQAQRSYEANLTSIEIAKKMMAQTLKVLDA